MAVPFKDGRQSHRHDYVLQPEPLQRGVTFGVHRDKDVCGRPARRRFRGGAHCREHFAKLSAPKQCRLQCSRHCIGLFAQYHGDSARSLILSDSLADWRDRTFGLDEVFVLNATVVPMTDLSYLTLWPQGESQPLVSTLR